MILLLVSHMQDAARSSDGSDCISDTVVEVAAYQVLHKFDRVSDMLSSPARHALRARVVKSLMDKLM